MPKIKFSHEYFKLQCGKSTPEKARLLEVFRDKTENLSTCFIEYDTMYYDKKKHSLAYYKLPKGEVIILLFQNADPSDPFLFTTIRRYTPKKYEYYKKMRGKEFEVVIEEKECE